MQDAVLKGASQIIGSTTGAFELCQQQGDGKYDEMLIGQDIFGGQWGLQVNFLEAVSIKYLSPLTFVSPQRSALQVVSASGIVFANKAVMTTFGFTFIYALTLIHTLFTLVGMQVFSVAVRG